LGSRRKVSVRTTKTVPDLAQEGKASLDVDYADANQAVLVWGQLNTHTLPASFRQSTAVT